MKNLFKTQLPLFICLFFLFCLFSCDKDDDGVFDDEKIKKVLVVQEDSEFKTYVYNSEGEVVRETENDGSYTTFTYQSGSVTHDYYSSGGDYFSYTCQLNADELTYSVLFSDGSNYQYQYDANDYLIKRTRVTGSGYTNIVTSTIVDGNVTNSTYTTTGNGSTDSTTKIFEYFEEEKNTIEGKYLGIQFLGKANKNPLKKMTHYTNSNIYTEDYAYTFDSDGYITTKITSYYINNVFSRTSTINYTYE